MALPAIHDSVLPLLTKESIYNESTHNCLTQHEGTVDILCTITTLMERIRNCHKGDKILEQITDEEATEIKKISIPGSAKPQEAVLQELITILSKCWRLDHPRFFSFIPSTALPVSWLANAFTTAFNPHTGSPWAGSAVCAVEEGLIEWLSERFRLPPSAGGQFVSGGSMANLTALTVARDQKLDAEKRHKGVAYISDQAHFCITKALNIIGLTRERIRIIPTDDHYRLDTRHLQQAISADKKLELEPFVVVATFGTTDTGSVDPLKDIADIVHDRGMWMHVDGAYGASAVFSNKFVKEHDQIMEGLEEADSIAWDAHKWLFQINGCAAVLFRHKEHPQKSFTATGSYVRDIDNNVANLSIPWNHGLELTRPARHMMLWFTLRVLGIAKVDEMVSHGFNMAELVEHRIREMKGWEIISPPTLAIVTFRYAPSGAQADTINEINSRISQLARARNVAAIFTTELKGKVSLRMCPINTQTTKEDIVMVMGRLDEIARELVQVS